MATNVATLVANLRLDNRDFVRGMDTAESRARSAGKGMMRAGGMMTAGVTVPMALAGAAVIKFASDAEESRNKVRVVFGSQAGIVERWAEDASASMGLSSAAAMDAAGTFGKFFAGMGMATGPARRMSQSLIELSGDMASFHNADPTEMLMAMRSGLAGETEPLRRFGINMTEAALSAFAMQEGIQGSVSNMTDAQKAQLRYAFILARTQQEQGDFARTSDGAANSMRTLKAQAQDVAASFGQVLLPIARSVLGWLKGMFDWLKNLNPQMRTTIIVIAGVAAVVGPLVTMLGGLVTAVAAIGLPVIAVVAAIAALAVALVVAYKKSETFRNIVDGVWEWLKGAAAWVGANFVPMVVGAFEYIVDWVRRNWPDIRDTIESIMNGVEAVVRSVLTWIQSAWNTWGSAIMRYVVATFNNVKQIIQGALDVVMGIVRTVMAIIRGDWGDAWDGIKQALSGVWRLIRGVVKQAINGVQTLIDVSMTAIAGVFDGAWDGIVKSLKAVWQAMKAVVRGGANVVKSIVVGIWNAIKSTTSRVWGGIKGAITGALDGIKEGIRLARDAIGRIWDGVKDKFRGPVQWVLDNVVNRFLGFIRDIAGFVGLADRIPGPFSLGGGGGGNAGQPFSAGSGLTGPQGGGDGIGLENSARRGGATMEALTGTGDGPGLASMFAGGPAMNPLTNGTAAAFGDTLTSAARGMEGLLDRLGGGSGFQQIMGGVLRAPIEHVLSWITNLKDAYRAPDLGAGIGWEAMWQAVSGQFPGIALSSSFRPGATTLSGNQSYHALGRAVDISPWMSAFDWIVANYGKQTKELIFTPAGGRQIKDGQPHTYSAGVAAQHWDHIHWAMANGGSGVVRRPTTFLAGEAGPEAFSFTPLSKVRRGGGDGAVIEVHVHGRATRQDGQAVVDALVQWQRRNGAVPVKVKG